MERLKDVDRPVDVTPIAQGLEGKESGLAVAQSHPVAGQVAVGLVEVFASPKSLESKARTERERIVEDYLAGHLPKTEHRIETSQDPECKVAVVLPAYAEGLGILRPLASLAEQVDIKTEEFEVIVVVNQSSQPPLRMRGESEAAYKRKQELFERASHENERTLAVIEAINLGVVPDDMDDEDREAFQKVIESNVRVHSIDKSSGGLAFEPDGANVGSARDRGAAEAVERFFKRGVDGIIAQSDADVSFDSHYLSALINRFDQDPGVVGVSGRGDFEVLTEVEEAMPIIAFQVAESYNALWYRLLLSDLGSKLEKAKEVGFAGCTMSSRAYALAQAGGVPHIAGGEDVLFGENLRMQGKIVKEPDALVRPLARFSARTEVGAGHGQRLLAVADTYSSEGLLVPNPDSVEAYIEIRKTLAEYLGGKTDAMPMLSYRGQELADGEDMASLREVLARASDVDEVLKDPLLKDFRNGVQDRLDKMYRPIPIIQAVDRMSNLVLGNDGQEKSGSVDGADSLSENESAGPSKTDLLEAEARLLAISKALDTSLAA